MMPLRPYDQNQMFLLPPSLNEWVREDHPVRVFSEIIDRLETSKFREPKEEGRPAYHPRMMVKILLWAYSTGIRSSRKIEERLHQDVSFMWLSGLERPDFRTLCLFRLNNREALEKIFTGVIILARAMGMASLGIVALDGSKVRANCGIDTFKKVEDWKEILKKTKQKVEKILSEAEVIDREEDKIYGKERRGDELPDGIQKLQGRIETIETLLKSAERLGKEDSARVSPVEVEAGFMHKANTSIPAYNAQLAVGEDQLIVHADVTTEPIDVNQIKPAIEGIKEVLKESPEKVVADTGYSGGENLKVLESDGIDGYIPESSERKIGKVEGPRPGLFKKEVFSYDGDKDIFICPAGQEMRHRARSKIKTRYSGKDITTYRTEKGICSSCSLTERCTTNKKAGRAITRDGYEAQRQRMRDKLCTDEGKRIYSKRKGIVEPVFGQIKIVGGFTQFLMRGLEKVRIEWKIAATAHNLLKITRAIMRGERMLPVLG